MADHKQRYLHSGGAEGHIEDLTGVGGHPFGAHCLIRHTGRKSGRVFVNPLCYGIVGGEVVIVASKGGADTHPDWYRNIVASRQVDFQIGAQAFRANWREPQGPEREKVWAHMVDNFPFYADYQVTTSRQIPVVMLTAVEPIGILTEG